MKRIASRASTIAILGAFLAVTLCSEPGARAQEAGPSTFATPKEAAASLAAAAKKKDRAAMLAVLGAETEQWITSGDPVQDRQGLEAFIAAYDQKNAIEIEGDGKAVLAIGEDGFPFPFPIVKSAEGWAFDPQQGREELFNRRIGRNELSTIKVLQAVVDAQREYASLDRNADGVLEYAAKLRSAPGQQDGLYWPTQEGQPVSPIGALVADAVEEGYGAAKAEGESAEPRAFHGYHFKLLKRQSDAAPGGALDYVVGGRMIGGFAVLAYPTRYGNSGIMSFMVSHAGTVYDADLGPDTATKSKAIDSFDPGTGWKKVEETD